MKNTIKILLFLSLFFLAASLLIFPAINKHYDNENGMRNVVINRLVIEAERTVGEGETYAPDLTELQGTYGDRYTPDRVEYLDAGALVDTGEDYVRDAFGTEMICPLKGAEGQICGFLRITYLSGDREFTVCMVAAIMLLSYITAVIVVIALYRLMVRPFYILSEYPEKIAKGRLSEGIPQSRSGLFKKYIWGMNMLKDEISLKDKNINRMEKEKQTLIISIAHGIKTPLSNIRLYAEAIERGIYHVDKKPDEKDAVTAAKITKNVEKAEQLVREIMNSSADIPDVHNRAVTAFYLEELMDIVKAEYCGRMELLHIPFETVCDNNPLLCSDKDGLYKVISQLLDNAIKYGSGQEIILRMGRQDEDVIISVKNKGNILSEEETAYVFKSFWRGSNANGREGQGIGLYVSKKIAERLGGDIFMKSYAEEDITEVTLIVPVDDNSRYGSRSFDGEP